MFAEKRSGVACSGRGRHPCSENRNRAGCGGSPFHGDTASGSTALPGLAENWDDRGGL